MKKTDDGTRFTFSLTMSPTELNRMATDEKMRPLMRLIIDSMQKSIDPPKKPRAKARR